MGEILAAEFFGSVHTQIALPAFRFENNFHGNDSIVGIVVNRSTNIVDPYIIYPFFLSMFGLGI